MVLKQQPLKNPEIYPRRHLAAKFSITTLNWFDTSICSITFFGGGGYLALACNDTKIAACVFYYIYVLSLDYTKTNLVWKFKKTF